MADAPPPFAPSKPFTTAPPPFDPAKPFTTGGEDKAKPPINKDLAALRMEQPELAAQWGVGEPQEGYRPTILPFTRDAGGSLSLTVPEVIAAPLRGAVAGGMRAAGVGQEGQDPLRPASGDILAATSLAASPLRFGAETSAINQGSGTARYVADAARKAAEPQQRLGQKAA